MNDFIKSYLKLLVSCKDIAGMNIRNFLTDNLQNEVITVDKDSIYSDEEINKYVPKNSTIIFISRHSARSLRPSFTVHPIGNFGKAEFGGKDNTLIQCNSIILKKLLLNIKELVDSDRFDLKYNYEISVEATHHGPFSQFPIAFIEVGSSEPQWRDLEACRLIAEVMNNFNLKAINQNNKWVSSVGFGGNHYANKFTKLILESENAIGHICAKYAIPVLNDKLIDQMVTNTIPNPEIAFFDKKSMKRKQEIRKMLSDYNIEVVQV